MPTRFTNKNASVVQPPQFNLQSSFQQSSTQSKTSTTRPFAPPNISISPTPPIQPTFSLIQKFLDTEESTPKTNEQSSVPNPSTNPNKPRRPRYEAFISDEPLRITRPRAQAFSSPQKYTQQKINEAYQSVVKGSKPTSTEIANQATSTVPSSFSTATVSGLDPNSRRAFANARLPQLNPQPVPPEAPPQTVPPETTTGTVTPEATPAQPTANPHQQTINELVNAGIGMGIASDSLRSLGGIVGFAFAARKVRTEKDRLKKFEGTMEMLSSSFDLLAAGPGLARGVGLMNGNSENLVGNTQLGTIGILGQVSSSVLSFRHILDAFKSGFVTVCDAIKFIKNIKKNKKASDKSLEDGVKNLMKTLVASARSSSQLVAALNNPAMSAVAAALGIVGSALSILSEVINISFSLKKICESYLTRKDVVESKEQSQKDLNTYLMTKAEVRRNGRLVTGGLQQDEYESGVMVEDKRGVFGSREVFERLSPGILAAIDQGKSEVKVTDDCYLIIDEGLKSVINEYELASKIDEIGSKRRAKSVIEVGTSLLIIGADILNIVSDAIAIAGAGATGGASLGLRAVGPALKAGISIGSATYKGGQLVQAVHRGIKGKGQQKALQEALQSGQTLEEINKIGTDKSAGTKNLEYIRQARTFLEMGARAAEAALSRDTALATSIVKRLDIYITAAGCNAIELAEFLGKGNYEEYIKAVAKTLKQR